MIALLILTAVALGLIAFQIGGVQRPTAGLTPRIETLPPAPAQTVTYLVSARPLPAGTLARSEDFTVRTVTASQLPSDAVIDTPNTRLDLRGSLVRRYLETGTPIRAADVMRPRERGFLAAVLPPGTRAVSIGVDPVSGVSGLIWPGDTVDVSLTQEFPPSRPRRDGSSPAKRC